MSFQKSVSQYLLQIKAIKLSPQNPFTWASGLRSPIYCDNRVTLSFPDIRTHILEGLCDLARTQEPFDAICGVATAGIPQGALLADRLIKPFAYVRGKAKDHGRQNQIEGDLPQGSRLLVVEDLISTGKSSLEAVQVLREAGYIVVAVIAVFDYGLPQAVKNFSTAQCPYYSLTNYENLVQEAAEQDYISMEDVQMLTDWKNDPENWYAKYFNA